MNNVSFVYCWRHERILKWIFFPRWSVVFCALRLFVCGLFYHFLVSLQQWMLHGVESNNTLSHNQNIHNGIELGLSCQFLCYIINELMYEVSSNAGVFSSFFLCFICMYIGYWNGSRVAYTIKKSFSTVSYCFILNAEWMNWLFSGYEIEKNNSETRYLNIWN